MGNGYQEIMIDPCQIKKYVNTVVTNITPLGINGRNKSSAQFPVRIKNNTGEIRSLGTSGVLKGDTPDR